MKTDLCGAILPTTACSLSEYSTLSEDCDEGRRKGWRRRRSRSNLLFPGERGKRKKKKGRGKEKTEARRTILSSVKYGKKRGKKEWGRKVEKKGKKWISSIQGAVPGSPSSSLEGKGERLKREKTRAADV